MSISDSSRKYLRCLIKKDDREDLGENHVKLLEYPTPKLEVLNPDYGQILKFVIDYVQENNDLPTFSILNLAFETRGSTSIELMDELNLIHEYSAQIGAGFRYLHDVVQKECHQRIFNKTIQEAVEIANDKYVAPKGQKTRKGVKDAVEFLLHSTDQFFQTESDEITHVEMTEGVESAIKRYELANKNKMAQWGIVSGLSPLDNALKGIHRKQLVVIAGAVGECKTTLAMNWVYHAVTSGYSCMFVSLEMSKENVQDIFYCLHANNPELQANCEKKVDVVYDQIKSAMLWGQREALYKFALRDWSSRGLESGRDPDNLYGKLHIWEPNQDCTPNLLASKAMAIHRKDPIDLMVIDYPGLMFADDWKPGMSESHNLNSIMKKLKRVAQTFDDNRGIAIISPFQINREGKKEAVKKSESDSARIDVAQTDRPIYSTYHLSYANEAERSADAVLYTYLNHDLRQNNQIHIGCIKNRHGEIFSPFISDTKLACRQIMYRDQGDEIPLSSGVQEISL